jgi:imidazolonepropionase-like amidohydrolase
MAGTIAKLLTSTIAALAVCAGTAIAAEPVSKPVYITADRMLDVATGAYISAPALLVEGGRITKLGSQSSLAPPADSVRVDLKGMTILPGLIDMHVHLTGDAEKHGYSALADGVADQVVSGAPIPILRFVAALMTARS